MAEPIFIANTGGSENLPRLSCAQTGPMICHGSAITAAATPSFSCLYLVTRLHLPSNVWPHSNLFLRHLMTSPTFIFFLLARDICRSYRLKRYLNGVFSTLLILVKSLWSVLQKRCLPIPRF